MWGNTLLPYIQIHFNLTVTRTVLMSAFCTVFIPYFPVRAYERDHRSHPQNEKNSKGGTRLHNRGVKDRTIESKTFVSSQTSFFDIFAREETTRIFREILVDIAQYACEKSSPKRALTTASLQALTRQSIFLGGRSHAIVACKEFGIMATPITVGSGKGYYRYHPESEQTNRPSVCHQKL